MAALTVATSAATCAAPPAFTNQCQPCLASSRKVTFNQQVKLQTRGVSRSRVQAVAGEVSSDGNTYLVLGAVAIALVGSAFPVFFARKDQCPDCDGSGFVRSGDKLAANFAGKGQQVVCKRCNGLGKLNQTDKV
eukprot:TRINITY_DN23297_c0_g1_i1.p1 TRINITY_DN23297_c0_g1~~TRINITY_DN23297_c0_g1_i1.p1  ORF type:complete len:134 (-),score=18.67 TRINITY_DN23297_c0_g1_i1:595-996(-)